jgi:hypothetical protein
VTTNSASDSETQVVIYFPAPTKPWSTNEDRRLHWAARAKLVKAWRTAAFLAATLEPGLRDMGPTVVTIEIPFERNARRDPMNYVGTCLKASVDGLVDACLWPDDTEQWVEIRQPRLVVGHQVRILLEPIRIG